MGKRLGFLVVALALFTAPLAASAASSWADGATWGEKATGKFKYGLTNTLLGWTSLFRTPSEEIQAGENFFVGVGHGIWNAVGQTAGGIVHLVTFPLTTIDIPLPQGGTDILASK
jgi:hypothetical protein